MIRKNIIYIHIPKCGGNSMKDAFENSIKEYNKDSKDIEYKFYNIGHMSLERLLNEGFLKDIKDDEERYYITVVRNPYERIISGFYYERKNNKEFAKKYGENDINKYLENIENDEIFVVGWRQTWFENGYEKIKNYKRFKLEKLDELKDYCKNEFNLELKIDVKNKTEHPGIEILNEKSIKIINNWYYYDFKHYGYEILYDKI